MCEDLYLLGLSITFISRLYIGIIKVCELEEGGLFLLCLSILEELDELVLVESISLVEAVDFGSLVIVEVLLK